MSTDRAYMDYTPAERIVSYIKSTGITVVRDCYGTLCVRAPLDRPVDLARVMQALAAYGPEIAVLLEVA